MCAQQAPPTHPPGTCHGDAEFAAREELLHQHDAARLSSDFGHDRIHIYRGQEGWSQGGG
jgi:hypothetical protein